MQKMFGSAIINFFILLFLSSHSANCAEQDPKKFITEFYTWYISMPSLTDALNHKDILRYVAQDTIDEIKKMSLGTPPYDYDYFLKTSNPPQNMTGVDIFISQVEPLGTNSFAAIVEFNIKHREHQLEKIIIILEKSNSNIRIIKCLDIYPEA